MTQIIVSELKEYMENIYGNRDKDFSKNCGKSLIFSSLSPTFYFKQFNESKEDLKDTKGVTRIRISKKNRQHNGQKKKYKRTNNDLHESL